MQRRLPALPRFPGFSMCFQQADADAGISLWASCSGGHPRPRAQLAAAAGQRTPPASSGSSPSSRCQRRAGRQRVPGATVQCCGRGCRVVTRCRLCRLLWRRPHQPRGALGGCGGGAAQGQAACCWAAPVWQACGLMTVVTSTGDFRSRAPATPEIPLLPVCSIPTPPPSARACLYFSHSKPSHAPLVCSHSCITVLACTKETVQTRHALSAACCKPGRGGTVGSCSQLCHIEPCWRVGAACSGAARWGPC